MFTCVRKAHVALFDLITFLDLYANDQMVFLSDKLGSG